MSVEPVPGFESPLRSRTETPGRALAYRRSIVTMAGYAPLTTDTLDALREERQLTLPTWLAEFVPEEA